MSLPIGIQLYSVKDETEKDFKNALRKVSNIGYEGVEFAGYGGLKSFELKALLEDLGLKVCGSHVALDELTENIEGVIEYNLEIGNPYIICPWASYNNREDFIRMAYKLNSIGEKCKQSGLKFAYHNHAHEFEKFQGEYGLDILYKETKADLVKAEIDTYWVKYAGIDPVKYVEKHAGRCELIHIKDMEVTDKEMKSTEAGNGIMDIKSIINESEKQEAKWLIVEQEHFSRPSLESIEISYKYLKSLV